MYVVHEYKRICYSPASGLSPNRKKSNMYPGLENEAKKYRVSTEIEGFL